MQKHPVDFNTLSRHPRAILRFDGGKGTITGTTLGPAEYADLVFIANNLRPETIDFEYFSGGLFGHKHWDITFKCSGDHIYAHIETLLKKLAISRPHDWDVDAGLVTLEFRDQEDARACESALDACVSLGKELLSLGTQTNFTIDDKYLGNATGHHFYATGKKFGGTTVTVSYVIPFDIEAYNAERKRLAREAEENNLRSQQDLETSENNNQSAKLDAETFEVKKSTTTGKTAYYIGFAAVILLVLVAVILLVKYKK